MSLNFGQIPPLTTKLAAFERLKNRCHHVISVDIDPIFFKLAGNKDIHNIMNEFEFRPDWITDYGVSFPWASKKYPHRLIMGKMVFPLFLCCFDWILLILSCNKNKHLSLDEFEFPPDQTTDYGVSCPWASKTSVSPLFLGWYWSNPF